MSDGPPPPKPVATPRTVVVGILRNESGDVLLCRMSPDRGVFPRQWGLPGGGIEPGEEMEAALRREIREEVGLELEALTPLFFYDEYREKRLVDGSSRLVYMIYLVFECGAVAGGFRLNEEFVEGAWVPKTRVGQYDLNAATVKTFTKLGWIEPAS